MTVGGGDVEPARAGGVVAEAQRDHLAAVGPRGHHLGAAFDTAVHDADDEGPPGRQLDPIERAGVEGDEVEQHTVVMDLDVNQLAVPSRGGDSHRDRPYPSQVSGET